jgi:hypothetical protein
MALAVARSKPARVCGYAGVHATRKSEQTQPKRSSQLAVYTAVIGGYEKTFKEPTHCNVPFIAYTDELTKTHVTHGKRSCWRMIIARAHLELDYTRGCRNSIASNQGSFNVAKFYKLNPHRLTELSTFKHVIWVDGTVRIHADLTALAFARVLTSTSIVSAFEHCELNPPTRFEHCRDGLLRNEVHIMDDIFRASRGNKGVYRGQDFSQQEQYYLHESGFREHWFANYPEARGRPQYGVWVTTFVVLNLANPDTRRFLDRWWFENANTTTQDQVTFSFVAWRTGLLPYSLPAHNVTGTWLANSLFKKLRHHV